MIIATVITDEADMAIKEIKETTFVIEIANDVCIEIEKAAVSIDDAQLKAQKNQ